MKHMNGGRIERYEGITDFSVNVNPFGTGRAVMEAVKSSLSEIGNYPDSRCSRLRAALAEDLGVPEQHLVFGSGTADLIFSAVMAEKPKKALIPVPVFAEYEQALAMNGCEIHYYKKREENGFTLEEDFLELLNEDIDMVFLCSPDNLTGRLIDRVMLWKILARCETYGIRMVVDECFIDFVENAEKATILADTKRWRTLFILRSFTAMHAVPGLRIGYGVSSDMEFVEKIESMRQPWSVSIPAQAAGMAALREKQRVKTTREFAARELKWMEKRMEKLEIEYFESHSNVLLVKSEKDLAGLLLERGLLIRDCSDEKGLGKGYYRIIMRQRGDNQKLVDALYEIQGIQAPKKKLVRRRASATNSDEE